MSEMRWKAQLIELKYEAKYEKIALFMVNLEESTIDAVLLSNAQMYARPF